jgi:competence protein ComGC
MRNLLIILFLILIPTLVFSQRTVSNIKENKFKNKLKSQLIELNKKKSKDIISIKAYKKSLQIKTKEIKIC